MAAFSELNLKIPSILAISMAAFSELNLKIPSILAISILTSILNFMLSSVEHIKSFITSGPELSF